jgi:N6-adenosine-specific RNA methylase IME4
MGEDEFFETVDGEKKSKKRKRDSETRVRRRKERDLKGVGTYKPKMKLLSMELMGADGLYYTIKKKVKMIDPLLPTYVRIPSQVPLPRSWARTIAPYTGLNLFPMPEGCTYLETDIMDFDLKTLGRKYQAILMDPPWNDASSTLTHPHQVNPTQLAHLRLDEVVENGLLLIWTEKQHIGACIQVAAKWGFTYVENLVWVKQNVNHTVSDAQHPFFARSKTSLFIFKKGSGFALRHQRNPDVIFDFIRENKYLTLDKPKYAYTIAETLLPEACFNEETMQGQFLEIWARRGGHRKGWTSLVQSIPSNPKFLRLPDSPASDSFPLPPM